MQWSPFKGKRSGKIVASRVGVNSAIIETLGSHDDSVSIVLIANEIGKSRAEIAPYITSLEKSGVIKDTGGNISLQSRATV